MRKRRGNYNPLRQRLASTAGLRYLWEEDTLPDGICPLGLPILADDRLRWWRGLDFAGVSVSRWWEDIAGDWTGANSRKPVS